MEATDSCILPLTSLPRPSSVYKPVTNEVIKTPRSSRRRNEMDSLHANPHGSHGKGDPHAEPTGRQLGEHRDEGNTPEKGAAFSEIVFV